MEQDLNSAIAGVARVETLKDSRKDKSINHQGLRDYCMNLFEFKEVTIRKFKCVDSGPLSYLANNNVIWKFVGAQDLGRSPKACSNQETNSTPFVAAIDETDYLYYAEKCREHSGKAQQERCALLWLIYIF